MGPVRQAGAATARMNFRNDNPDSITTRFNGREAFFRLHSIVLIGRSSFGGGDLMFRCPNHSARDVL